MTARQSTGAAFLAGLLSFALSMICLRNGVYAGPNSWSLWEVSVSLAETGRYEFFSGRPGGPYSPLYPGYLALVQYLSGVSGHSVALSMAILCGISTWAWCLFAGFLARDGVGPASAAPRWSVLAAFLHAIVMPASAMYIPEANCLQLCFIPAYLAIAHALSTSTSVRLGMLLILGTIGCLALMTLAHYSGVVFIPFVVPLILLNRSWSTAIRVAFAGLYLLLATGVCGFLGSHWFGQVAASSVSTNIFLTGLTPEMWQVTAARMGDYWAVGISELARGVTGLYLPVGWATVIAPVLLLASVTLLARAVHGLRDWDPGPVARETRRRAATTTVLVFGGLAMNYLLHITTKQEHPLSSGRFLWYVVLALYPVVLYAAASWRAAAVVFVVLTLGVPVARCVKYGLHGYLEKGRGGAFTDNEIRGEYVISRRPPGPAPLPAGSVWVATPDYPWTRALKPTK